MINVGVIGYGYWGPNLVRNFAECPDAHMLAICDLAEERLAAAQRRYPTMMVTRHYQDLLANPKLDAIAIATPVSTHYELAIQALRAGKHVLVEKPLTTSSQQALKLLEEASRRDRILMVDHTFIYSNAVRKIRELVANNELGDLYYYDAVRVNLGLFQHDINVIWDLAVHDLAIMNYVLAMKPNAVSATGMSHVPGGPENIAYLSLFFDKTLIGHIHVNWLAPVKIRRTLIGGSRKMIVYDELEPSEKIKVYDKGITVNNGPESVYELLIDYRSGDMWAPQLGIAEPLQVEVQHFVECVMNKQQPLTPGEVGLDIVQILEAATQSLQQQGQLVKLNRLAMLI